MIQYDVVGYAPRSPRDWWISAGGGREAADRAAAELLGPTAMYRGVRPAATMGNETDVVGICVIDRVIIVIWSGRPDTALRWDRLTHHPTCQRFHVGVYPASDGLEARWTGADGSVQRHVSITDGHVVIDEGQARVFDEHADTDRSLDINIDDRLPKSVINNLLQNARPDEIELYDGRRYVRTDDRTILKRARIVRHSPTGKLSVAVDQAGRINTLRDPLGTSLEGKNSDALAAQLLKTWFRFAMTGNEKIPPMHTYTWRDDPTYKTLAEAITRIRSDQATFFSLIVASDSQSVVERLAREYELDPSVAEQLLEQPLRNLIRRPN